ncbi:MAG TPA: amidohydrolase family protein, partial [Pirellulales bacterium]
DRLDRAKLLVERDLQVDVNGSPDTAINAARLAEKCPELRIVINHCGNLLIDGKEPARAWREGVAAAAKHPHVFCKVSALVEQTAEKPAPRTLDYYRPTLDHLWNCFGEERLVFGSNWPVSDRGAPFETVVALVRDYFNEKGTRAAERYFFENSKSAYAWPKR